MKGLGNLGNTCYFNCALQCLLQVPQLSNFLILKNYDGPCEFTKEYQCTVRSMWLNKNCNFEVPVKLLSIFKKKYPQFDNFEQQDSQEAFLCLLDILDKSLSIIRKVFYSKMVQETICPSETSRVYEDTPMTIVFPMDGTPSLENILKGHQKWSTLENFTDSRGKTHYVSSTRTLFWTAPPILAFTFRMYHSKIMIEVPNVFDLAPYMHKDGDRSTGTQYVLFASCKHRGSVHGGHYLAVTMHRNQWYMKDDDSITKMEKFPSKDHHYFILYKKLF